jgi:hypothetical protein
MNSKLVSKKLINLWKRKAEARIVVDFLRGYGNDVTEEE